MTIQDQYSEYMKELDSYLASDDDETVKYGYQKIQHENSRPEMGAKLDAWRTFFFDGGKPQNEFEAVMNFLTLESEVGFCEGYLLSWPAIQRMPFHDGKLFFVIGNINLVAVFEDDKLKSIEAKIGTARLFAFAEDTAYLLKALELYILAGNGQEEAVEFDANAYVASLSKEGRAQLRKAAGWSSSYVSRIASRNLLVVPGQNYSAIKKFAEQWSQ